MGDSAHEALISPDWDFNQMGIGGLDKEFSDIFRRAFASRVFPPDVVEQMGMKHVRGILLFGPPGKCHAHNLQSYLHAESRVAWDPPHQTQVVLYLENKYRSMYVFSKFSIHLIEAKETAAPNIHTKLLDPSVSVSNCPSQ